MSKKPYFRTRFFKQRVSGFETMLQSPSHHYNGMFPWIWDKVQVFPSQYAEFPTTISNAVISETKSFFWIFYCVSEIYIKFRKFWKKRWAFHLKYSRNNWLQTKGLLKCLKCLTSEHVSVNDVLAGSKHCWNQHGTTITECFNKSGKKWVGKSLS